MRVSRRPITIAYVAVAAAAIAFLAGLSPALAQGASIHFGTAIGEDRLIGDGFHRARPERNAGHAEGVYDREPAARAAYRHSSPSVIVFHRSAGSTYDRGTGIFANAQGRGGGWVDGGGSVQSLRSRRGEEGEVERPKIIDVASARLDRRPIGPSGLSVQYLGSAKIIRIAPGYGTRRAERPAPVEKDMAALPEPAGPPAYTPAVPSTPVRTTAVPAPTPAPERTVAEPEAAIFLEPWTDDWLRDCVARHEDFDASLGTYTGEDGLRRFCTGDAG